MGILVWSEDLDRDHINTVFIKSFCWGEDFQIVFKSVYKSPIKMSKLAHRENPGGDSSDPQEGRRGSRQIFFGMFLSGSL